MSKRDIIQTKAVSDIIGHELHGIAEIAPRVGKSKIVIDALKQVEIPSHVHIHISVPFKQIIKSWKEEFKKWYPDNNLNVTYGLHKNIGKEGRGQNLIIVDEFQKIKNKKYDDLLFLAQLESRILGLSGFMNKESWNRASEMKLPRISHYPVNQAINDGIISDFEILAIPLQLNRTVANVKSGNKQKTFYTSEEQNYNYYTKRFNEARMSNNHRFKMSVASMRANGIYNYKTKIDATKEFLSRIDPRLKVLTFTARINVANELCAYTHHSKSEVREGDVDNLTKFQRGDINSLAVCETVSMGVTIPNLKVGVFHQIRASDEDHLQKMLRLCNIDDVSRKANIYIFYFKDTVDEDWMMSALKSVDRSKVKFHGIEE